MVPSQGPGAQSDGFSGKSFGAGTNEKPTLSPTSFIRKNPTDRYRLPVVSLSNATNELFDYNRGIYMLGKIFDDYVKAHPTEPLTGHTPANYTQRGEAWERPGFLEWFEPDGTRTFTQSVVVDIQGQSSRSFRQKSLGLKLGPERGTATRFEYPFFPGLTNRLGDPILDFDHLRLANSGNDWAYTLLRDALCHRLVANTPTDTLAYRPVAVYLDGEFWGVHNLREQQDPDYLKDHYGVSQDEVVICETVGNLLEGKPGDNNHYLNLISYVSTNDLSQAGPYAYVGTQMDLQNFIAYQVAEIYFGNADWPHNNIRFWRRRTPTYLPTAPPGQDGRWRWLLFDVDLGYGHPWSGGFGENSLSYALDPNGRPGANAPWSTLLLRRLMTNSRFKTEFINTFADALNTRFKESVATNAVGTLQRWIEPAMPDHIARWRTMGDSTNGWKNEIKVLNLFASQRPIYVRQHLITQFGLSGFANLTLDMQPRGAGEFQLNSLRINENTPGTQSTNLYPWKGIYFRGVPIQIEAIPRPGYRFVGWVGQTNDPPNPTRTITPQGGTNLVAKFERAVSPHSLNAGPFLLTSWSRSAAAGTYPEHMFFEQTAQQDPGLDAPLEAEWSLPYNLGSRSRVLGLEEDGIGFINTSDPQNTPGAGYLGSAVLTLDTLGVTNIVVSWIGGTVETNEQSYALRLQYAVGESGFLDLHDSSGNPVEYSRHSAVGHSEIVGPTLLPPSAENQPWVRLRWKYYRVSAGKGKRPLLRLDDIYVTSLDREVTPWTASIDPSSDSSPFPVLSLHGPPRATVVVEQSSDLSHWLPATRLVTDLAGRAQLSINLPAWTSYNFYRWTPTR